MKRKGYTIAEVLVTMAIIGVVASLTIPTFISGHKKTIYSKTLSNAVSNFNNAMSALMIKEGVNDLLSTQAWQGIKDNDGNYVLNDSSDADTVQSFMDGISKTLILTDSNNGSPAYRTLDNPNGANNVQFGNLVRFKSKNGVEYQIEVNSVSNINAINEKLALLNGCNYTNRAADVFIDINGPSEPNIFGRDCFRYELGVDGKLYPYGGRDWYFYVNGNYDNYGNESPKTMCVNNSNGYYCSAYLMENGYNMDY